MAVSTAQERAQARQRARQQYEASLRKWRELDTQVQVITNSLNASDEQLVATQDGMKDLMRLIRERDEAHDLCHRLELEMAVGPRRSQAASQ